MSHQPATSDYTKFGDFTTDGREFAITRFDTPKLWNNFSWNREIMVRIDQRGRGESLYRDSAGNRTNLIKDRIVYIKDHASQKHWTVGWDPVQLDFSRYRCCHGLGYTRLENRNEGIETSLTTIAAADAPVEMWEIVVTNSSKRRRSLSIYPLVEFDLSGFEVYGTLECTITSEQKGRVIYGINRAYERMGTKNSAFMAVDADPASFETSKRMFLGGRYGNLQRPAGVTEKKLSNTVTGNEDEVGVFQLECSLRPGQSAVYHVLVGPFTEKTEVDVLVKDYLAEGAFARELAKQRARTASFGRVEFSVGDAYCDRLFNLWAKQQLSYLVDYSRGTMMGFRDTMQDAQAFCPFDPARTKATILLATQHQMSDGSCLRGWWPLDTHPYSDSGVWMAFTVSDYLKETGDFALLREHVAYHDGGDDTIYDHIKKALAWIYREPGPFGITRVFFGDWNDSLGIGRRGIGESVWLAIALAWAYRQMIEIAERIGDAEFVPFAGEQIAALETGIEQNCWDGKWYLQGFTDDGEKVGSRENDEGRIYSNPQTWAIMSGLAARYDREELLEKTMQRHLTTDYGLLVCEPAYTYFRDSHGRISAFPAGWGENGSSYCHVSAFKAVADCVRRDGDAALESIQRILATNPKNPIDVAAAEPYGFTNMFNGPAHRRPAVSSRGWYTGTVGWVLRCVTQWMIGVRPAFDGLVIDPVLPKAWPRVTMKRIFRDAEYDIVIVSRGKRTAGKRTTTIRVDGGLLEGNLIPCQKFGGKHRVEVVVE